jgi:RNA polymerase sigma factor (sigma-70 family)
MPALRDPLSAQALACRQAPPARQEDLVGALLLAIDPDLKGVAAKAARSLGRPEATEDLWQEARLAVLEALESFDPSKGEFRHYALSCAKSTVQTQQRLQGALVQPEAEARRLARLAEQARDAFAAERGRQPDKAEWREALRLRALAQAVEDGANEQEAEVWIRRLNLNRVDPARAVTEGRAAMLWIDAPGTLEGAEPSARLDRLVQSHDRPTADDDADLPSGALMPVLAREAVRLARRRRAARQGRKSAVGSVAELRQQSVVRRLLSQPGLNLRSAAEELGCSLVLIRKWLGEAQHAITLLKADPEIWALLLAEARNAARQEDLLALAPAPDGDSEPAQRQLALLYALASAPQGRSAAELYADLPGHYSANSAQARERALKRDVENLRSQGWPLLSRFQGNGEPRYALAEANVALDGTFTLSESEAQAVHSALTGPWALGLAPESRQALRRLLALRSPLQAPAVPPARSPWPLLLAAIEAGRACDIRVEGRPSRISVSLYAWFCREGSTWVLGWDHDARNLNAWDLGQVQEARDTATPFQAEPPGFNAQRWVWEQRPWRKQGRPAPVRLQGQAAEWARQRWTDLAATPAADGAWDLSFNVSDDQRFLDFLLGEFGSEARLLPSADAQLTAALRRRLAEAQ